MGHVRLIQAIAVAMAGAPAYGAIISEEFTAGIPASWSTFDYYPNGTGPLDSAFDWTTNVAEGYPNYTAGTGMTAAASSEHHSGPYDVSLWTPAFVLPEGPNSITYKVNFQHVSATEALDTRVSINGGPWITMVHQTTSLGASHSSAAPNVTVGVSLSFYGAVAGDICIVSWRYYETSTSALVHNSYVELDDVTYPVVPSPGMVATVGVCCFGCVLRRR